MENIKIKNYFNKMSKESQIILVNMLSDNLVYLHDFNVVDKEVIRGISSLIILLMDYKTKNIITRYYRIIKRKSRR